MTSPSPGTRAFVVIGETNVARRVCATLQERRDTVVHLHEPGDRELRAALGDRPDGVAILLHDDVAALRYALAVAHLAPSVPIVATVFDRTVSDELERLLPQCDATSPADLAAPALAGPCVDPAYLAVQRSGQRVRAVRARHDTPYVEEWQPHPRRLWRRLEHVARQLRPHDAGARLLLIGLFGILAVLLADWAWLVTHGLPPAEALFHAARVVAGVGPATAEADETGYEVASSVAMLATLVFSALFTAGVIERMLGPKLIGLIGPRTLPRSEHVIVVGMGQVGMRLCAELQRLDIPVVGVERDPHTTTARLARSLGIPVMTGHGGDRAVLEKLRLGHARALAAVGSDDLDNIAVALAAHGVAPGTRVVIRAGEHEAIAETRSLLPMGTIRDVTSLAAAYVLARLLREPVTGVVAHQHDVCLQTDEETFVHWPLTSRDRCPHTPGATSSAPPARQG
ncbi:NAD-binding protein [Streptomyces sp. NBC_00820]|uniref:potassium channel family protein n=1 Tax=Streptomyces sp. NBC_00820 TaxID=2975842 RepID=UPI002ED30BC1|nr:NAD-binding protein [Streptomyces sp. NBC_00820]